VSAAKTVFFIVAALFLQLMVARYLRPLRYLDFVLIVTTYIGFGRNPKRAMVVGATAGLIQDGFSGGIVGANSFVKTVIAFLTSVLSVRVALERLLPRLIVMAGAAALNGLIYLGLHELFGQNLVESPIFSHLGQKMGWLVAANTLAGLFLFYLFDYLASERGRAPGKPAKRRY